MLWVSIILSSTCHWNQRWRLAKLLQPGVGLALMLSFTQSKLYIFIALCTLNTAILVGCFCLFVSFCNILNINDKQKTSFKISRNFPVCPFVVQHVGLVVTCPEWATCRHFWPFTLTWPTLRAFVRFCCPSCSTRPRVETTVECCSHSWNPKIEPHQFN